LVPNQVRYAPTKIRLIRPLGPKSGFAGLGQVRYALTKKLKSARYLMG
jgi:hypothetical protein